MATRSASEVVAELRETVDSASLMLPLAPAAVRKALALAVEALELLAAGQAAPAPTDTPNG